jgi:hypothetical protein
VRERGHTPALTGANTVWVLISFEGPDAYSRVGGLGTRVTELGSALAALGFETHHIFLGDPTLVANERRGDGRLVLHRWAQWLGDVFPGGVYDGEVTKAAELAASVPGYVVDQIIRPAADAGKLTVVLAEEWQTTACACVLADECSVAGLADHVAMLWNANSAHGLERVDWAHLSRTNTITTTTEQVSVLLRAAGTEPVAIPTGIPERFTHPVGRTASTLRAAFHDSRLVVKLAPVDHEAGWRQALDAVGLWRDRHEPATLVAQCQGPNAAAGVRRLREEARARGLFAVEVGDSADVIARLAAIAHRQPHLIILAFGVDDDLLRVLASAADAVLANAVLEPFSVSDLAAMAAGGIVFTGGAAGDYAVSARNAVVLETSAAEELVWRFNTVCVSPRAMLRIRRAARATARRYTWDAIIGRLLDHVRRMRPSRRIAHSRTLGIFMGGNHRTRRSETVVSPTRVAV